ncbi:unnamed protein product [Haemonchus placei]|uniref:Uncharacterized protein n=1 Tax=Haemonchus placei TaxID=6290 RepID=A0A158QMF7_HAEPC|nr:unnamed protein product [Haemonchus placei]
MDRTESWLRGFPSPLSSFPTFLLTLLNTVNNILALHLAKDAVGLLYKEICRDHGRVLWYRDTNDAKKIGITETSLICEPFKEELTPDAEKLAMLSKKLNELVQNFTLGIIPTVPTLSDEKPIPPDDESVITTVKDEILEDTTLSERTQQQHKPMFEEGNLPMVTSSRSSRFQKCPQIHHRSTRMYYGNNVLFPLAKQFTSQHSALWNSLYIHCRPVLLILSDEALKGLQLKVPSDVLQRYEKIGLYLPGICADYVPKAVDEFDSSSFEGIEIEGPIGLNMTALEAAGVNLTALAEKLRNDTEVDDILSRTNASIK